MACDAIGALLVTQKKSSGRVGREANHRVFAVPAGSERDQHWADARTLPSACARSSRSFFVAAGALANKDLEIVDWVGPDEAVELIKEAQKKWKQQRDVADDRLEKEQRDPQRHRGTATIGATAPTRPKALAPTASPPR